MVCTVERRCHLNVGFLVVAWRVWISLMTLANGVKLFIAGVALTLLYDVFPPNPRFNTRSVLQMQSLNAMIRVNITAQGLI